MFSDCFAQRYSLICFSQYIYDTEEVKCFLFYLCEVTATVKFFLNFLFYFEVCLIMGWEMFSWSSLESIGNRPHNLNEASLPMREFVALEKDISQYL